MIFLSLIKTFLYPPNLRISWQTEIRRFRQTHLTSKMAQDNRVNIPSGFGGLTRFSEEYTSYFNLKPVHVIGFVIFIIAFRILLEFIY